MDRFDDHLDRFVRAVHRRLVVVRAMERGGACAVVGCLIAAVMAGAGMWLGRDALGLAAMLIAGGAGVGVAWSAARRPTLHAAAAEADRQLDLKDLLATALAVRGVRDNRDGWNETVFALADARCRTLSPRDVVLNRYGARGWGGIGLAVAFALTLGMLSTAPLRSEAASRGDDGGGEFASAAPQADVEAGARDVRDAASDRAVRERDLEERGLSDAHREDPANREAMKPVLGANARGVGTEKRDGAGAGEASASGGDQAGATERPKSGGTGESGREGEVAGGGKGSSGATAGAAGDAGIRGASQPPQRAVPRWRSSNWQMQREAALRAVSEGRVPDAYRDVVREYFRGDEDH